MAAPRRNRTWETLLMALLLGSIALVFWYESSADPARRAVLEWVDLGLCALFLVEWSWRAVRSGTPARWAVRHGWELLGMVPLLLPVPSALRVLRLVRFVRILRLFGRVGERIGVWERVAKESQLHKIALASGSVTLVGATVFWLLERGDNPNVHHFWDAVWWSMETVTTVGYGDITPVTSMGRVVAALLMLAGIGTIGLLASSVASVLVVRKEESEAAGGELPAGGVAQELSSLARLHQEGRLSDDEFRKAKQRVLR